VVDTTALVVSMRSEEIALQSLTKALSTDRWCRSRDLSADHASTERCGKLSVSAVSPRVETNLPVKNGMGDRVTFPHLLGEVSCGAPS
jgi:hypothetical protein